MQAHARAVFKKFQRTCEGGKRYPILKGRSCLITMTLQLPVIDEASVILFHNTSVCALHITPLHENASTGARQICATPLRLTGPPSSSISPSWRPSNRPPSSSQTLTGSVPRDEKKRIMTSGVIAPLPHRASHLQAVHLYADGRIWGIGLNHSPRHWFTLTVLNLLLPGGELCSRSRTHSPSHTPLDFWLGAEVICIQQSFHYTPLGHKIEIQFDYMFLLWIASWDISIGVSHQYVVKVYCCFSLIFFLVFSDSCKSWDWYISNTILQVWFFVYCNLAFKNHKTCL